MALGIHRSGELARPQQGQQLINTFCEPTMLLLLLLLLLGVAAVMMWLVAVA